MPREDLQEPQLILVTGGCGFIGSHLCEALIERGCRVRVLDDLSSGHRANLAAMEARLEVVIGDVREPETVRRAMEGVTGVFHEAALVSVFDSVNRPADCHAINATGTLNVLLAARDAAVRRVVFAGTAAAYGNNPELPKHEDMRPEPESPYAVAKVAGEHYLRIFSRLYGLETIVLRYFNVYGPRQDPRSPYSGVISKFVADFTAGRPPTIFGDGLQTRDFVFVKDVAQANLRALFGPTVGRGQIYNVGSGRTATLRELSALLGRLTGRALEPVFQDARAGDIQHSAADISRLRAELGFEPAYDLERGLRSLLDWARCPA